MLNESNCVGIYRHIRGDDGDDVGDNLGQCKNN